MNLKTTYRVAVGLAVGATLLLLWIQGAVATADDSPGPIFFAVLAVGIIGALLARFRPEGMARAMFVTALAQAFVAVGAMFAWQQYVELSLFNGFFIALWISSALLFRKAARLRHQPHAV
ncbi:MAG: hypothetical protein K0Q55_3120 [Verrucomicrobia bacterium]|jgi:chromate transport protein ChrA|nr:hypothetical protein [Verrucomicrobiota bacterium]